MSAVGWCTAFSNRTWDDLPKSPCSAVCMGRAELPSSRTWGSELVVKKAFDWCMVISKQGGGEVQSNASNEPIKTRGHKNG